MPATFLTGTDWQCSSGPIITRQVTTDYLWPEGGGSDSVANGDHPILAIGAVASRPFNMVGFVVTYESNTDLCEMNVAPGFVAKAYVYNITGYSGAGTANAWSATLAFGTPVYIDDDASLLAGGTLSLSPVNGAGAENPLAGYVFSDQVQVDQSGIGGRTPTTANTFPLPFEDGASDHYLTVCVMLWPSAQD